MLTFPTRSVIVPAGVIACAAALALPGSAGATGTSCSGWNTAINSTTFTGGRLSARVCAYRASSNNPVASAYVEYRTSGNLKYRSITGHVQLYDGTAAKPISPDQIWRTLEYPVNRTHAVYARGYLVYDVKDDGNDAYKLVTGPSPMNYPPPPSCQPGKPC